MKNASARLCTSSWHGAGRTHNFFLESALKRIHRTLEEQPQELDFNSFDEINYYES